jgi:hypothetical protein
MENTNSNPKA